MLIVWDGDEDNYTYGMWWGEVWWGWGCKFIFVSVFSRDDLFHPLRHVTVDLAGFPPALNADRSALIYYSTLCLPACKARGTTQAVCVRV